MSDWFLTEVQKLFQEEVIVFSANGIGATGHPYAKIKKEPQSKHHNFLKRFYLFIYS